MSEELPSPIALYDNRTHFEGSGNDVHSELCENTFCEVFGCEKCIVNK